MEEYAYDSGFVKQFDEELLQLIKQGITDFNEELLNELARQEFIIQYNNIDYLRELCSVQGLGPEDIHAWNQIPAVPSAVFKERVIAAFPLHETELTIMTSGTSNPNSPSKIYRDKRCVEM